MAKVLIIEDDPTAGKILQDYLAKEGLNPALAIDAMQGQQAIISRRPDLVVLDLMLPAGHGLDILRNLRQSVQTQAIPVVVITSCKEEGIRQEVEGVGVQGYFVKPVDNEALIKKIKLILGQ